MMSVCWNLAVECRTRGSEIARARESAALTDGANYRTPAADHQCTDFVMFVCLFVCLFHNVLQLPLYI